MAAEGRDRLIVFQAGPDRELKPISTMPLPSPRYAALMDWPGWGLAVAVAPFGMPALAAVQDFDPVTGQAAAAPSVPLSPAGGSAGPLAVADLDQDGSEEVVFVTYGSVYQVRQPADASERPTAELIWDREPLGSDGDLVVAADVDNDGDIDLLTPDEMYAPETLRADVHLLRNTGDGTFEPEVVPYPGQASRDGALFGLTALDFGVDADGTRFLAAAEYSSLTLWRISGPEVGSWEPRQIPFAAPHRSGASWLYLRDLDRDGHMDMIVTRRTAVTGKIIYGPLWDHFEAMQADNFNLK
jgi:hypothetical protein